MFDNYYKSSYRDNPINLLITRTVFCLFAIWKLLSYNFTVLKEWPDFLFKGHFNSHFLLHPIVLEYLWIEVVIVLLLLVALFFGYKIKLSCFLSAVLLTHLTALHYAITNSGSTWLPVIYFLVVYAIYSDQDKLSIDHVLSLRKKGIENLNASLRDGEKQFDHDVLKIFLVVVALIYFFTGVSKLVIVGFEWVTAEYLNKLLVREYLFHLNEFPFYSEMIVKYSVLGWASGILTIFFEVGFLVAVLLKRNITMFIIGLAGLHLMIYLTMEILFFDQFILYLLFVPWDNILRRRTAEDKVTVVYDDTCLWAATLHVFKYVDLKKVLSFHSIHEQPPALKGVDLSNVERDIYVQTDGKICAGFFALRALLRKWWILFPFYKILFLKPIEKVVVQIYSSVARNRRTIDVGS